MQKIILPIAIVIGSLIVSGAYYTVQLNKQKLVEQEQTSKNSLKEEKLLENTQKTNEQLELLRENNDKQAEELEKLKMTQGVVACQKRKEDCEAKVYNLQHRKVILPSGGSVQGERQKKIDSIHEQITIYEQSIKKEHAKKLYKRLIKEEQKSIGEIKIIMANEKIAVEKLLSEECRDYQKDCE
jgi:hypothetical protein